MEFLGSIEKQLKNIQDELLRFQQENIIHKQEVVSKIKNIHRVSIVLGMIIAMLILKIMLL